MFSKQDAPKGYLKLLLLTAASGGSGNGESIQRYLKFSFLRIVLNIILDIQFCYLSLFLM